MPVPIPPPVAVASGATQITGGSVAGVAVHLRRGGADLRMAAVMTVGGLFGSLAGAFVFRALQESGQIDLVIGLLYVVLLGWIGALMLRDAMLALGYLGKRDQAEPTAHTRWLSSLPMRWRFAVSGLYISPLAPFVLGIGTGILTVLLGVGGGFIIVPAMIYLLGMPE